jgi:hypothetical protein
LRALEVVEAIAERLRRAAGVVEPPVLVWREWLDESISRRFSHVPSRASAVELVRQTEALFKASCMKLWV